MANTHPNLEGIPEIPGTSISMKTAQVKAYIGIANGILKRLDHRVNMLVSRLGLQSIVGAINNENNVTVKRQTRTCNQVFETCDKTNESTYAITEFANIPKKLPANSLEVLNNLIVLRELAITMKSTYDKMYSAMNELQEEENHSSGPSQRKRPAAS